MIKMGVGDQYLLNIQMVILDESSNGLRFERRIDHNTCPCQFVVNDEDIIFNWTADKTLNFVQK